MIRNYVDEVEYKAAENNYLTEDVKSWKSWANKSADWYDPTISREKDGLLIGIDIESLRIHNDNYSFGYDQKERSFWKPWWSK